MPIPPETRTLIFAKLKATLEKFTPPLVVSVDKENTAYEIMGNKPVPYGYDKKIVPGMYFASIAQRSDSVTMHFFPIYMNMKMMEVAPSLHKHLKGKTCFHFKKAEQVDEKELAALLAFGVDAWYKSGYML